MFVIDEILVHNRWVVLVFIIWLAHNSKLLSLHLMERLLLRVECIIIILIEVLALLTVMSEHLMLVLHYLNQWVVIVFFSAHVYFISAFAFFEHLIKYLLLGTATF